MAAFRLSEPDGLVAARNVARTTRLNGDICPRVIRDHAACHYYKWDTGMPRAGRSLN